MEEFFLQVNFIPLKLKLLIKLAQIHDISNIRDFESYLDSYTIRLTV